MLLFGGNLNCWSANKTQRITIKKIEDKESQHEDTAED